jgi:predicted anti-sigma-YlaC factor YlaD
MNCHAIRAVLDLHAEGRLTPRRAKAVDAHLAACPDCRAAALKAERRTPEPRPAAKAELSLWPRDMSGVAIATAALALIAVVIGWSGAPNQQFDKGDELAAGRTP